MNSLLFLRMMFKNKGFISKLANVKDPKRFNVKMPLKIKFGVEVVVSNQWDLKTLMPF